MVPWLSKLIGVFFLFPLVFFSQESDCQKYQDRSKFSKKAKLLAAWQIKNLRNGALIIRIPDEPTKIKKLILEKKEKEAALRYEKFLRKYKAQYRYFLEHFTFCKFYFIYAKDYRRVLNGERKGFFLDSSLCVNDSIELKEKFFMIAEEDDVYASTLGFVKESCAMEVHETGLPALHANWVIKNKYGHQVKEPFPIYVSARLIKNFNYISFNKNYTIRLCDTSFAISNVKIEIQSGEYRDDIQRLLIMELNDRLEGFYVRSKLNENELVLIKDYLY